MNGVTVYFSDGGTMEVSGNTIREQAAASGGSFQTDANGAKYFRLNLL